jgi:type IV pilus assembly protein PilV
MMKKNQSGIAMLEALIAILIFSFGILGTIGAFSRSTELLTQSNLRVQAAQEASDLIAEMYNVSPGSRDTLYSSATNGSRYVAWRNRLTSGSTALPGVTATPPVVVVNTTSTPIANGGPPFITTDVTITIFWAKPGADANQYITTARILEPQS